MGCGAGVKTPGCGVKVLPCKGGDSVEIPEYGVGRGVELGNGAGVGDCVHSGILQHESLGSVTNRQFGGSWGYTAHLKWTIEIRQGLMVHHLYPKVLKHLNFLLYLSHSNTSILLPVDLLNSFSAKFQTTFVVCFSILTNYRFERRL